MDEDEMFQDAAQTLLDGQQGQGDQGNEGGDNGEGGMPDAEDTNIEKPIDPPIPPVDNQTSSNEPNKPTPPAAAADAPKAELPINFEGISKGLVKSPEDITRISDEYRQMKAEVETLRAKVAVDPFSNEFVKTLDLMTRDGKSQDQIKAFIQLQELGEISKLSPIDAMLQAKVLRDGHNADIARKLIERKYKITPDMDPEERELVDAQMKDDAKADYEYLTSQKKDLATPAKPTVPDAAAQTLSREAIMSKVEPLKERVKQQFTTLGQLNLNAKFDDAGKPTADAVLYELPIPKEFIDKIPAIFENFFVEAGVDVNEDNVRTAMGVINYELFNQQGQKIIQDACIHYGAQVEKRIRDEYELKGTAPKRPTVNQPISDLNLTDEALEEYVNGR